MCRLGGGRSLFGTHSYTSFDPRYQVLQTAEDGLRNVQESIRVDMLKRGNAAGCVVHVVYGHVYVSLDSSS